ncbi:hypothetical protein HC028_04360 [Planosporangium flavigriseum]|uniref:hypothetical protein n=1 Tax=Planosporangium flavigriseum TaxID=373681 RepID=UPI00143A468F|nr:hypothetical protein [Planosporangium flavigriseum]NJC63743.1 hypothetical protein [Planosporangium flavigriseum]
MSDEPKLPEPSSQQESGVVVPSKVDAAPAVPAGRSRRRVVTIALAVVLGALAVLCVGGLGFGYVFYRQISEPDRKTPAVVVEQFVEATFNERDHSRVALFTCRDAELSELNQVVSDLRVREGQFNTRFTVQTANLNVRTKGESAAVETDLQLSTPVSRSTQLWRFAMKNQSGWRVCGASRLG